ncbi:hypothetical protein EDD18DRAFT_1465650 [Armillaria luteobubalina]|uniref:Uncharacterized protein n=1 Tax=Armillaria luteobubalina TaxID=153913 RepID=A0AA39PWJ0_9AGAR|nr:hypothetical protein EDD18DRAFT_1465650 [Armillaria luteobubalina]
MSRFPRHSKVSSASAGVALFFFRFATTLLRGTVMFDLLRLDQYGALLLFIHHSIDDFMPQDFMDYEFMASNYIHSTEGLNPSRPIPHLAFCFKDPLSRGWDTGIRDTFLSSKQADWEGVALWISRLRAENISLRNTLHDLSNDNLLSQSKKNLNISLSVVIKSDTSSALKKTVEFEGALIATCRRLLYLVPRPQTAFEIQKLPDTSARALVILGTRHDPAVFHPIPHHERIEGTAVASASGTLTAIGSPHYSPPLATPGALLVANAPLPPSQCLRK